MFIVAKMAGHKPDRSKYGSSSVGKKKREAGRGFEPARFGAVVADNETGLPIEAYEKGTLPPVPAAESCSDRVKADV